LVKIGLLLLRCLAKLLELLSLINTKSAEYRFYCSSIVFKRFFILKSVSKFNVIHNLAVRSMQVIWRYRSISKHTDVENLIISESIFIVYMRKRCFEEHWDIIENENN